MSREARLLSPVMVVGAVAGFLIFLGVLAWSARPQMEEAPKPPPPEQVKELRDALNAEMDPANPQRLQVEVDYAQGANAAWFPKNESPVLTELVKEGKLPPLAERIGPEPIVYRGSDGIGRYGGTWISVGAAPGRRLSEPTLVRCDFPHRCLLGTPTLSHPSWFWDRFLMRMSPF
jgi:hypothetical protein